MPLKNQYSICRFDICIQKMRNRKTSKDNQSLKIQADSKKIRKYRPDCWPIMKAKPQNRQKKIC